MAIIPVSFACSGVNFTQEIEQLMTDMLSAETMGPLCMFLRFSEHIAKYNLQQRQLEKCPLNSQDVLGHL